MENKRERNNRGNRGRQEREYDQKLLDLARVTRVVRGGRRFRFRATVVIGNKRGKVGIGMAKGSDVSDSIAKAFNQAKKNLVNIKTVNGTIAHEIRAKYKSAKVLLKPAKKGRGIVVGGAVRQVVELAGIRDLSAKILGKGSKVTNAMAALKGLTMLIDGGKNRVEERGDKQEKNLQAAVKQPAVKQEKKEVKPTK